MYTYGDLIEDKKAFKDKGAEVFPIGLSKEGREIVCFAVGHRGKAVISTAAIHARENASAYVVLAQLKYALTSGTDRRMYFIPLVNPDGAALLQKYYDEGDEKYKLWKANAAGVDLNVNFDARWGEGKQNVRHAGSENYIGEKPFSEPESKALALFTARVNAALTLSYHTAGRELYWYFFQKENYDRDFELAKDAEKFLGYKYARIDSDLDSAGGYKDWCVSALSIPAFTIELGSGAHPLKKTDIEEDIKLNEKLAAYLSEKLR